MRIRTFDRPKGYLVKRAFANSGTFTDPRDGNVYKTVEINGQIWLAENLRFEGAKHYAPDNYKRYIKKYGCLYKWEDAMRACPEGWHLPSKEEFNNLLNAAGSSDKERFKNLCAIEWEGKDSLGFKALPAGLHIGFDYSNFGFGSYFWSSTECRAYGNEAYHLIIEPDEAILTDGSENSAYSVRCIKD